MINLVISQDFGIRHSFHEKKKEHAQQVLVKLEKAIRLSNLTKVVSNDATNKKVSCIVLFLLIVSCISNYSFVC